LVPPKSWTAGCRTKTPPRPSLRWPWAPDDPFSIHIRRWSERIGKSASSCRSDIEKHKHIAAQLRSFERSHEMELAAYREAEQDEGLLTPMLDVRRRYLGSLIFRAGVSSVNWPSVRSKNVRIHQCLGMDRDVTHDCLQRSSAYKMSGTS
jgi:hypothetical protein